MVRPSSVVWSAGVGLALWLTAAPVEAQSPKMYVAPKRFEITPIAGYQWGGSLETSAGGAFYGAGDLRLKDSFAWGGILSFLAAGGSALELSYLQQATDIEFDPAGGGVATNLGGFDVHYVQIGGRQEFGKGGPFRPFISGSLGIGIFDPKPNDGTNLDSDTRFSWSVGGGAKYMFASGRAGLRTDLKLWVTPFPSGDYGIWCGYYTCTVAEGTEWVTQGQITGGLVLAF
jgi:hypothetical protein